jgi:membrane protein required for colicin V production
MNLFDIAVYLFGLFAVITGFNSGLLRSLATILAYAVAAPLAVVLSPRVAEYLTSHSLLPPDKTTFVPLAVLIVAGMIFGFLMRRAVGTLTGGNTVFVDRLLGALLGAARILLVAVLLVLIFTRIIPPGREPSWYAESKLRPLLLMAGEKGLRTMPPQLADYIDRLKRERGL